MRAACSSRSRKPGLAALERDEHFLLTTAILSDIILALDDRERALELYDVLLPYQELLAFHDLLRGLRRQHLLDPRRAVSGAAPPRRGRRALRGRHRARACGGGARGHDLEQGRPGCERCAHAGSGAT